MLRPVVSVVMAVFNDERYVPASVESILGQTFSDFEFIIIDDASTDGTSSLLAGYAGRDQRIRVITQKENGGLANALNLGLSLARGEFVARMDSDDVSLPQRFERQLRFFEDHPETDILGTFAEDIDEGGARIGRLRRMPVGPRRVAELVWANPLIHPSVMLRTDKIRALGGYDESLRRKQDYALWFRAVEQGLVLDNLPEALLYYREGAEALRKHSIASMWQQLTIGLKGSYRLHLGPKAYLGVTLPFVVHLFPFALRRSVRRRMKVIDPRRTP